MTVHKIVICFAAFIALLSGCGVAKTYSLAQSERNIAQIEIIDIKNWHEYTPGGDYEFEVVREISAKYHSTFLEELYDVPCYSYYGSPYDGFAENTIRISYLDGSFELVSEKTVYYEAVDGDWTYPSYDFEEEAFNSFLSLWKAVYSYRG